MSKILYADRLVAGKGLKVKYLATRESDESGSLRYWKNVVTNLRKFVPVFDIQNVCEYMYDNRKDGFSFDMFTCAKPPFANMWLEGRFTNPSYRFCCYATDYDMGIDALKYLADSLTKGTTYHLLSLSIVESDTIMLVAFVIVELDENGKLINYKAQILVEEFMEDEEMGKLLNTFVLTILMSFQFLNCKNVKTIDNPPEPKLSKAFKKRNGVPLMTYKTISVSPERKSSGGSGSTESQNLKSLHIVRGHFAKYTPEHGFLGRKLEHEIMVWKPAHIRGNAENGVVIKDYKVETS